ncbi:Uu.00g054750.m01.CDS01 [Anthostomella pinea]|uniref:Uu.00g054750.m01.CDS01 n=1 Tax=Anthostomella pinea TaxID=933095 RepID=A0AAI8VXB7_9PEZI|nr:Uu.00g054750.m01.CDS01 [Anthostomella pinea]
MPRDGSGRSHNAPELTGETDHDIIHGAGNEPKDDHVARADKTAPMPEPEKGLALEGVPATAGQSQGLAEGPDRGQGGRGNK